MVIGKKLYRALSKLFMRAVGEQAKTACGNLQMCIGLEAVIQGVTYAMGQRRLERTRVRWKEGEEAGNANKEEESGRVAADMGNLRIETAGTVEEAAEELDHALEM